MLKKGLVGLHKTKGNRLEKENEIKNRSLCIVAYKHFVWWIYQRLVKENRRASSSCVLWEIRQHHPEANGQYILHSEGKRHS